MCRAPWTRAFLVLLVFLPVAACADLGTEPASAPAELRVAQEVVTTTVGQTVDLPVTVVDGEGAPLAIPPWAPPRWTASSPLVVTPVDGGVRAEAPGSASVTVRLAGLEKTVIVRVNPAALRLEIAHVAVTQAGNSGPTLERHMDARIDVFLVADQINFFRPAVRVTVLRNGGVQAVLGLQRQPEGVPLALVAGDLSNAWSATIPGELIQPGAQIVVEADPDGTVPLATGSQTRFPAAGSFALDVRAPELLLRVEGAYLTQSVQTFSGSVPLVAGRDALLRVFMTGEEENDFEAAVRATIYLGGTALHQLTLRRPGTIPLHFDEGKLTDSWNATIPGAWLVPGASLVVEGDPEGAFALKPGSVPRLPAAGTLALDVRPVPRLWLRMIPIHQVGPATTGSIDAGNLPQYLAAVTSKFPIAEVDADLRGVYFTNSTASTESGWQQILREVEALRTADGSRRYYYGVLRRPGGSNVAGIGYIGWPAAVGYDQAPRAFEVFAHEIGHNFSLLHAPCGGPSGVDPAFPYPGGGIGVYGYDLRTGQLRSPAVDKDLMSYCTPEWISDYSYRKAMDHRERWDWTATGPSALGVREPALLLWGGVQAGELVLEPAFELEMAPNLPSGTGAYRLQGFDDGGAEIFSYRFDPSPIDHLGGGSNFAFAIPTRLARSERLARLRLSGPEGEAVRERSLLAAAMAPMGVERDGAGVALSWGPAGAMALVRDRATGEILSLARGGAVVLPDRPVEVLVSDGVRTSPPILPNP